MIDVLGLKHFKILGIKMSISVNFRSSTIGSRSLARVLTMVSAIFSSTSGVNLWGYLLASKVEYSMSLWTLKIRENTSKQLGKSRVDMVGIKSWEAEGGGRPSTSEIVG